MPNDFNNHLPGIKVANHSRRGMDFQAELDAAHEWYLLQGLVDMVNNESGWSFCGESDYFKGIRVNAGAVAKDGNGRFMRRVWSNVDYSGGNRNQAFTFDAKETSQKFFPLSSVHPHQVHRLKQSSRCGVISGLMIKFKLYDRVFFVPSKLLNEKFEIWQRQSGGGRARPGTAHISIAECELTGTEIFRHRINRLWDWFEELKGE